MLHKLKGLTKLIKKTVSILCSFVFIFLFFTACEFKKDKLDLYYPIYSDPTSFDPQIANDNASKIIIANCFEGLVRTSAEGKIVPGVASSWDISSDGLTYTFHLRNDAKWHLTENASKLLSQEALQNFNYEVTSQDFVFGLRRAFDSDMNSTADSRLALIKNASEIIKKSATLDTLGVKAIDNSTLVITLSAPNENFLSALTQYAAMPCREEFFLATKGRYGLSSDTTMFNGPFYIYSWNETSNIFLSKNESYKGESGVNPDNVYLYVNANESTRVQKISDGVYDVCPLSAEQKKQITNKEINYLDFENTIWALTFNLSRENMDNENIRRSVFMATSSDDIDFSSQNFTAADGIIPPVCKIAEQSYRNAVGKINPIAFNSQKSRDLWLDGLDDLSLRTLNINVLCPESMDATMRKLVQKWQKSLGISLGVIINALPESEYKKAMGENNYDIVLEEIQCEFENPSDFLRMFAEKNSNFSTELSSPQYKNLIEKAASATKSADVINFSKQAEAILLDSALIYPLFYQNSFVALAENLDGVFCIDAGTVPIFLSATRSK